MVQWFVQVMFIVKFIITLFCFLSLPSGAWAFVSHDYPATFVNEMARIYFLVSCLVVLGAMIYNRLHKERIWRNIIIALLFFILWDLVVFAGQTAEHWVSPYQIAGSNIGWDYFKSTIMLNGKECFFYYAKYDYLLINIAMFFFYSGLRSHLRTYEFAASASPLILPLLPVFLVEISGACIFVVLSSLSLITSVKLYNRDKTNILWNYMIWQIGRASCRERV